MATPQWLVVVPRERTDLLAKARESFAGSPLVGIVLNRRGAERRVARTHVEVDRRHGQRRRPAHDPAPAPAWSTGPWHVIRVPQGREHARADCPRCRVPLAFEMPRFVEPPARLATEVVHCDGPTGARHFVELQTSTVSGRPLLACRIRAHRRG